MAETMSLPGAQHEAFLKWAKAQGVKVNGVAPINFAGRGLGVIAQRRIEAKEEVVRVPASALLTTNSISSNFKALHKGITVHGLIASFLAFGGSESSHYSQWKALWPSMQDFRETLPILWPEILKEPLDSLGYTNSIVGVGGPSFLLPPAIGGKWRNLVEHSDIQREARLLHRQEMKLNADWKIVSKAFPGQTLSDYTYYWLCVNTRSFYFDALGGQPPDSRDDRIVLCPFADFFNHQDHGCDVNFSEEGYTITSDRAYDIGEEIHTSYGAHGNDFLLTEYGFILETNKWDSLPLDDFFCDKKFQGNTKNRLMIAGYFGDYTLNAEGVCHRTQVAVRTQTLSSYQWRRFVENGETTEEGDESRADSYLCLQVLKVYYGEARDALEHLAKIPDDKVPPQVKIVLNRRWKQIQALIRSAFHNSINEYTRAHMHETFD